MHWWPSSVWPAVCLSVCPVPDPKSRMEGRSKLKIYRREADHTGDRGDPIWRQVSRPINAETENAPYPPQKGDPMNLKLCTGMKYDDAHRRHSVTSKVKGQGYNVTSSVWRLFAHNLTKKIRKSIKLAEWLSVPRVTFCSKVKRSKVKVTGRLTPWPKITHIFGMGRP